MSYNPYGWAAKEFQWGAYWNYERDYRIAWGASKPHVRALIGAMRMRGRGMYLKEPLKGGVPTGKWFGRTIDNRAFEVDFNGLGRVEVPSGPYARASISMSGDTTKWETMWVREETWKWIVAEIIGDGPPVTIKIVSDIRI